MEKKTHNLKAALLTKYSWATTATILIVSFLLVHYGAVEYGASLFMVFPFAVGFSIGTLEKKLRRFSYVILGLLISFGFLLAGAFEGVICVLMALPIFALMLFIGYSVQKRIIQKELSDRNKIMATISPIAILLIVDPVEQMILPEPEIVTITNSIILDFAPEIVFEEVKQMDKLDADKPIGLILGLPAPYKCELEADTVGAQRICLFENGKIVAQISQYEPGKILEMKVIDYTLTGRDWFKFVDAAYIFEEMKHQTKITRTSSYTSILNPRFYWEPLEIWGIEQEHEFVLNSLKKNLKEKYTKQ